MALTEQQISWVQAAALAARKANHIFPNMAACEAALESKYGTSKLAEEDNNLFGMKQHQHPVYGTAILPTREFENGEWEVVGAAFVKYPDQETCFYDRMATLQRLAAAQHLGQPYYPHYKAALAAPDEKTYILEVSKTWSTDPNRGQDVLDIYNELLGTITQTT